MTAFATQSGAKETRISAVVTRKDGTVENLGVIAYWHKNPLRRWTWKLRRLIERRY